MRLIVTMLIAIFLTACGGGGGSETPSLPEVVSFDTTAETITAGQAVNLTAVFTGGYASIDNGVGEVTSNTSKSVTPTATTTYTLTASNSASRRLTKSVTVTVVPAPESSSFVSSAETITAGQAVNLTAVFIGGYASIDNAVGAVSSNNPTSVTPTATTTYTLTATNAAGTAVTSAVTVTVVAAPAITSFVSAAGTITAGDSVNLTAVFADGTASINNAVGTVTSNTAKSVTPAATKTYTLTATNAAGTAVTSAVTVTVVPAPAITSFVSAAGTITAGDSVNLTAVFADGTASINNAVGTVTSNTAKSVTPAATKTYTLTATNAAGTAVTSAVTVTVVPAPAITSFVSAAGTITAGQAVDLTAVFADGTASINNAVGAVTSNTPTSVTPTSTTTFRLTITNSEGVTATESVEVIILPTVTAVSPLSGAVGVSRSSVINGTFSEALLGTSIVANSLTLSGVTGTVALDASTESVTLTPASSLKILTTYSATLSEDISNLTGDLLGTDYTWSFTTVDGDWGSDELIEADNAGNALDPQIAVDGSGNAIAVWRQSDDGVDYNIWASRFDGASPGTPTLIETEDLGDAVDPQIAVNSSGKAIAVWHQNDGTQNNVWANGFNGTSWGIAEKIGDNTANARYAQIAIDSSGNAFAVWEQTDGTQYNIWSNRFNSASWFNGSTWGTAVKIETENGGNAYKPQIALDGSGNAIAVWRQNDGTRYNISANRFNGTSWGTAELILTENLGSATRPQIAFDGSGNAIAVWSKYDGIRTNIYANRFNGASWGVAVEIETDDAWAQVPQIAVDSSGNAIAVWKQSDGSVDSIWANRFNESSLSWGITPENIEIGTNYARSPQIAVDSSGNAIAVWRQSDPTQAGIPSDDTLSSIYANRFD